MSTKRIINISIIVISLLSINACSSLTPSGMPVLKHNTESKNSTAIAGKDFKLIPITNIGTSKYRPAYRKGIAKSVGGYQYRIGTNDILSITVWDHPELTIPAGEVRSASAAGHKVGQDGKFFFPFAGKVQAKGLTTDQIRQNLEGKLSKFITKPQVGVRIANYRSQRAFISGAIESPGVLAIDDIPLTIRDIIGKSGGLTNNASNTALLKRQKGNFLINLDALLREGDDSFNYVLRNGDSLHVRKKDITAKVFVMGEVKRSGSIPFDEQYGLTLAEALSDSGSINEETANPSGIFVVRRTDKNERIPSVYQLKLSSVHSMYHAEQFNLHPRDIVYVTTTPLVRWNRIISRLLPSLNVLDATKVITN